VWLSPGTGEIWLARATAWDIASPGFTQLGIATGILFDTGTFHALRVTFTGSVIEVYYDGRLVIRATDTAYRSGMIALDVTNQPIDFDDVLLTFGALAELLRDDFNGGAASGWTMSPLEMRRGGASPAACTPTTAVVSRSPIGESHPGATTRST